MRVEESWIAARKDALVAFGRDIAKRFGGQAQVIGRYGSVLLSLSLLAVVAHELGRVDVTSKVAALPWSPLFWLAFLVFILVSPLTEWLMLRHLLRAPLSGVWVILRKMVYNDMLLSYLGDAYLFTWIRRELGHVKAPFAVVKDMAIVSAFMGSVTTLAAIFLAWPLIPQVEGRATTLMLALALPLASGGLIALFRGALLSLPRPEILFIAAACAFRILAQTGAAIVMWTSLLPQVPLSTWVMLATIRMIATRLPLVPNKDLAFAAVTVALIAPHGGIAPMIVMTTSLVLVANMLIAIMIGLGTLRHGLMARRQAPA